jgi:hypothetical protein
MIFYEKKYEAKRFGRFNYDYLIIEKTEACLRHETDSVKPDKSCFRTHFRTVLNSLYLSVFIKLIRQLLTSIFKQDLLQMKGIFKYFKYIHSSQEVIDNKVIF